MLTKKNILILAALAVLGFGASMGVSLLMGPPPRPSDEGQAATQPAGNGEQDLLAAMDTSKLDSLRPSEEMLQGLIRDVKTKSLDLDSRERKLAAREKRVRMAEELLKEQAQELETLRRQLVPPLTQLAELQRKLESTRYRIAQQEKSNLKGIAQMYEKMDATSASETLEAMCKNQQDGDAVRILYYMQDRNAAKVLGEMKDKTLAARLTESMKRIQEEG